MSTASSNMIRETVRPISSRKFVSSHPSFSL
jgi:hypothetical protein